MDAFSTLAAVYLIAIGIWLLTVIVTLIVIYRRKDIARIVKYFWTFLIIIAPVLGVVAYFIWGTRSRRSRSTTIDIHHTDTRRHLP